MVLAYGLGCECTKINTSGLFNMKLVRSLSSLIPKPNFFLPRTFTQTPHQPHKIDATLSSINSISSNPMFLLLNLCNNISSLKKVHAIHLLHGLHDHHLHFQTKLVSLYSSFGNIRWARLVFDHIQNPDLHSWKVMVRHYYFKDLYSEIIRFYRCMRQCLTEHDNVVFSIVLKACTELHDIDEGRKIHGLIVKVGNPDSFVLTGLVDMYAKLGHVESSRLLFKENEANVVSWTSMIVGYVQNGCSEDGLVLFNQMRECLVEPNEFTLGTLLTACTKLCALHQGKWVHGYTIKNGIALNLYVVASIVDLYVKCGTVKDARSAFDELNTVDIVPWTAMIVGYTQRNLPNEALALFTDKRWATVLPNSIAVASALSACAQSGNLNLGMSVHAFGMKLGLDNLTVKNALVHVYAKFCMIRDANYMFETISEKDMVAWNSMIAGYAQNGNAYEALKLFSQMRNSFALDAITVVSILSACALSGTLQIGCALHAYAEKEGYLSSNVYVGTALLNLYSKCGDWASSRRVFDEMKEKNTVTWSSMMAGYGMHGDASGSLSLFDEMLKENLEPNEVVFTIILSACSHTEMVDEGWKYFSSMCKEFNVEPSMKHYVCMVDLLARAGRLEEAMNFIKMMPVQADARVWGALLHGCRLHSRMDLGEEAAKKLLELQPDKAGYYVLMSNLYASDGRWEEVNEMRKLMKEQGLNKSPGRSEVEMDNNDTFLASRTASLARI